MRSRATLSQRSAAGNICRSPTAEASFRAAVEKAGLADQFDIDSCGTGGGNAGWYIQGGWSYHEGDASDPRMTAAGGRSLGWPTAAALPSSNTAAAASLARSLQPHFSRRPPARASPEPSAHHTATLLCSPAPWRAPHLSVAPADTPGLEPLPVHHRHGRQEQARHHQGNRVLVRLHLGAVSGAASAAAAAALPLPLLLCCGRPAVAALLLLWLLPPSAEQAHLALDMAVRGQQFA